ncbi:MAG TPA: sigma-70 family RNA polymerase sigma factor [Planctomycetota bacterium]|nr:sigma-70 family RNA polymerase sigma factor [Planctomycetota bacterium]
MTATGDTSIGGSRRDFPSTSWSLIRGAGKAHREHLERLIYLYWKPAYHYLRACGHKSVEDAKDLTQDFFARLVERKDWERLSPDRGSFRGFLKRALKNFMIDAARREQARRPADGLFLFRFEEVRDAHPTVDPEHAFDREWIQTVLRESIRDLQKRLETEGSSTLFDVFRLYCLADDGSGDSSETSKFILGGSAGKTYAEVAQKLGLRESDVRKRLARCRALLRDIVLDRIRDYSASEDEAMTEFEKIVRG